MKRILFTLAMGLSFFLSGGTPPGVTGILSPDRSRMIRLTPDATGSWISADRGCVADQPQHRSHFHPLRLVEDDTAAIRLSPTLPPGDHVRRL